MAKDLFASCTLQALLNHAEAQDESHWWQVGIEYCPLAQWGTAMYDRNIWVMHEPEDRSYAWCYAPPMSMLEPEDKLTRLPDTLILFARAFDNKWMGATLGKETYLYWLRQYINTVSDRK